MNILIKFLVLFSILLFIETFSSCGQTNAVCPQFNKETALKDIKESRPKLLLFSGIAARYNATDPEFSKKYGISFFDFGCTPAKGECILAYNKTIFEYLDKKFGEKWRREVREDIVGLKSSPN